MLFPWLRNWRPDEDGDARALIGAWSDMYFIERFSRSWGAVHLPSGGVLGPFATVAEMRAAIQDDYRARPVARRR